MRARLALTRAALPAVAAVAAVTVPPAHADHRVTTSVYGARFDAGVHSAVCAVEGQMSVVQVKVTCSIGDLSQSVTVYGSRGVAAVAGVPSVPSTQACAYVEATWLGIDTNGRIYKARDTETVCEPVLVHG